MQKVLGNWNDILVFVGILWVSLILYGVLPYPNEKFRAKGERLKSSKWWIAYQFLIPLLLLGFLFKIFYD